MTGHPDVAEISDLAEGLLPPSRTAEVRQHLETCELCADVFASLEEIQGLLGTLPGPTMMPDDVAGRIDAALAAEVLPSATVPDSLEPAPTPTPAAAAPAASDRNDGNDTAHRVSRETSTTTDRPSGHARPSSTGPGRKGRKRIGRRRIAVLGAVAAAAAIGLGSVIVSSVTGGSPSDDTALADTFSEGKLQEQVASLIADDQGGAQNGPRTPRSFGMESETGGENRVFKQPTVPECIRQGIGRDDAALATKDGVYKGKEALLVVLPDASNDSRVTAYIVESACVAQPAVSKAEILLKHSYARS
ncbi:anti-sigma factor [Streptomyces sp. E2N166]|uniref:anti-sigma factor family protein n=1 Tax=Streptomyces sp. E2N166 TaxID=1851909 RepID=UPI000EF72C80|nr:anti-sigma factor [Streptomyces sp. E2N166]